MPSHRLRPAGQGGHSTEERTAWCGVQELTTCNTWQVSHGGSLSTPLMVRRTVDDAHPQAHDQQQACGAERIAWGQFTNTTLGSISLYIQSSTITLWGWMPAWAIFTNPALLQQNGTHTDGYVDNLITNYNHRGYRVFISLSQGCQEFWNSFSLSLSCSLSLAHSPELGNSFQTASLCLSLTCSLSLTHSPESGNSFQPASLSLSRLLALSHSLSRIRQQFSNSLSLSLSLSLTHSP